MITVEGQKYKVVEDLGYSHDVAAYAKVVDVGGGKERIATRVSGGMWQWHIPQIRPPGRVQGQ